MLTLLGMFSKEEGVWDLHLDALLRVRPHPSEWRKMVVEAVRHQEEAARWATAFVHERG